MDCNLSKHIGTLKAEALLADKSPLTAAKLRGMVISVIGSYSGRLAAWPMTARLARVVDASQLVVAAAATVTLRGACGCGAVATKLLRRGRGQRRDPAASRGCPILAIFYTI
jgi:hypothetical protein